MGKCYMSKVSGRTLDFCDACGDELPEKGHPHWLRFNAQDFLVCASCADRPLSAVRQDIKDRDTTGANL